MLVEEFDVQRKTVVDGVADLLHRLLVGVPALQEAAVAAEDLLLRAVWCIGHLRELFELVVDVDDGTVLQPVIADHHRLLNRTQDLANEPATTNPSAWLSSIARRPAWPAARSVGSCRTGPWRCCHT